MADKTNNTQGWKFDNSYSNLPNSFYNIQNPTPVPSPKLVVLNHSLAKSLGLNPEFLQSEEGVLVFSGNQIPEGARPLAQAYAGHQFGHFTMLGDGRALLLGEQITPSGKRFDIQLKGSGRTPYSRGGDGKAALGPMLREYIISEAMYALGIPTTRSLAVVTTGEKVMRETFLPGAVLTRIASSHLRVGTFEFAAAWGALENLRSLADYTMKRHFTDVLLEENPYLSLLKEVVKRQAKLIAKWQLVGFIHGVMNTDNMAISGETIDYGPCAFMDIYDPATVFSSIDTQGRYAYGNQPEIAVWNLSRFAEAIVPLIHDDHHLAVKLAKEAVEQFQDQYFEYWYKGMRGKLGLFNEDPQDEVLIKGLMSMMQKFRADYTNTFRSLTLNKPEEIIFFGSTEFVQWQEQWQKRLDRQGEDKESVYALMKQNNPAVIPRNHRVEAALEAAEKNEDYSVMEQLLKVLADPYAYSNEQTEYSTVPTASGCYRTFCGT